MKRKELTVAYLRGERAQSQLFPASLEDYIGPDDPARIYDAFVDQMDWQELGITLDEEQIGPPEFEPKAMMKLLVYGYAYGIRSSRKLERATHHNVSFMWLMGGLKPDHKTIARFRKDNLEALRKVLKQCVRVCLKLGLIEGNTLFVDGSKVRANAGMKHSWTKERCEKALAKADEQIEAILRECEAVDSAEEGMESLMKGKPELREVEARKRKIQEILRGLDKSLQKIVNTTDPDCNHVHGRQGTHAGYNLQVTVDDQAGLIVNSDVVSDNNDRNQLARQVEQANEMLGKNCQRACADAGYADTREWKTLEEQGIEVIAPSQEQEEQTGPFSKDKFTYDAKRDCYTCPEGHALTYCGSEGKRGMRTYRPKASHCQFCSNYGICTSSRKGRTIKRILYEEVKERVEARYQEPESQVVYKRRKEKAEHPFGHLKRNLGLQAFLLRGLRGVRAEAAILATCFNLRRMMTLLGESGLLMKFQPA
jgi:transposase